MDSQYSHNMEFHNEDKQLGTRLTRGRQELSIWIQKPKLEFFIEKFIFVPISDTNVAFWRPRVKWLYDFEQKYF